ncbi:ATPase domain-containing protein [Escherichia coli]
MAKVQKLSDISLEELPRFSTGFKEFDRVLGGGVVPGSAILIGGNPGAGKSTLLLQTLCKLAQQMKTLYVTERRVAATGGNARSSPWPAD